MSNITFSLMTHKFDPKAVKNDTKTVSVNSLKEMADLIVASDWAPAAFSPNYRKKANFDFTEVIGLDFDIGELSLQQAVELFEGYRHIIGTTENHQKPKKDAPACDRFRVILFLDKPVTSSGSFDIVMKEIIKKFDLKDSFDKNAKDSARFFKRCEAVASVEESGELLSTVELLERAAASAAAPQSSTVDIKGAILATAAQSRELSYHTLQFLLEGADTGNWNNSVYSAALDMHRKGYTLEEAVSMFEKARPAKDPDKLIKGLIDSDYLTTVKSAFQVEVANDGKGSLRWPRTRAIKENGQTKLIPLPSKAENDVYFINKVSSARGLMFRDLGSNLLFMGDREVSDQQLKDLELEASRIGYDTTSKGLYESMHASEVSPTKNRFLEPFLGAKWDGIERIDRLYDTLVINPDWIADWKTRGVDIKALYTKFLRNWVLMLAHRILYRNTPNEVLILAGPQGVGKNRWLKALSMGIPRSFNEGHVEPKSNDHTRIACQVVIWHVQELDGLFRKREAEALKSFFSLVESEIRLPFGIGMTPCRTMASFCGSTNTFEFLSDPTGNRRFLTLNIEDCLVDKEDLEQVRDPSKICLNDLDLRQVYAEARHRVEAGERIYFSKTEAKSFAQYTDIFRYKSAILEEFESRVAVGNPSEDRFYGLQELRNTLNLSGLSNLSDRELFKLDMDMKGWLNKHGAVLKVVSKIKKYCVKILPSAAASHSLDERMRGLLTGKGGAAVVPPGAELVTPAAVRAEDLT